MRPTLLSFFAGIASLANPLDSIFAPIRSEDYLTGPGADLKALKEDQERIGQDFKKAMQTIDDEQVERSAP